jgi:hypothetical protein
MAVQSPDCPRREAMPPWRRAIASSLTTRPGIPPSLSRRASSFLMRDGHSLGSQGSYKPDRTFPGVADLTTTHPPTAEPPWNRPGLLPTRW